MRLLVVTALSLSFINTYAQDYPRNSIDLSRLADDLIGFQESDINYEDLLENYVQLFSNPINLNSATAEDLRSLNILNETQVNNLLLHLKENGNLLSVYELQSVPDFDQNTINKIIPFVVVDNPTSKLDKSLVSRIANGKNNYFVTRYERTLQKLEGFKTQENSDKQFLGSPDKLYMRFRTSKPGDYSMGFTTEKDAGENIAWQPKNHRYGMDYWSYHVQLINKNKIKNLIVGDYQCQFGQGLLLGNAFGLGKGGETVNTIRKSNLGFMPYTSVNEAGYLRGVAGTFALHKNLFVSAFYANTNRDASINDGEFPSFTSLNITGLHRNDSELAHRKTINEVNYGTIVNFKNNTLDAGLILHAIQFSIPVNKTPSPYNQFAFGGDHNVNGSAFINYTIRNFNLFAEAGKSYEGGAGVVAGVLTSLHPKLDMAVLYRRYDKNFYTFYANAFSENTSPQNESGIYWGWKYRINKKYNVAAYVDLFKFPWLKFRTYKPSAGDEFLLRFNYQPSKKTIMFIQFRQENKDRNQSELTNMYVVSKGVKRNLWLNFDYTLHPNVRMKTRAQFSTYDFNGIHTTGMTILQDIIFSIGKLQLTARHALFDTDNFDNRQYVYENDVWLAFSLPVYDGVGIRNYAMAEYKFNNHFSTWLRYSRSYFYDRNEIGTGLQKIEENKKEDIKLQLLFRF